MTTTKALFTAAALALLTGARAAQSYGAGDAPAIQARAALPVKAGRVIDVQAVQIEVPATGQAQALGGVIGALGGAYLAQGSNWQGQALASSIGAAAGAKAGQMASREMREAQQVIVQPDHGEPVAVIQELGAAVLTAGQRVYLVGQHPALRVVPAQ